MEELADPEASSSETPPDTGDTPATDSPADGAAGERGVDILLTEGVKGSATVPMGTARCLHPKFA